MNFPKLDDSLKVIGNVNTVYNNGIIESSIKIYELFRNDTLSCTLFYSEKLDSAILDINLKKENMTIKPFEDNGLYIKGLCYLNI